MTAYDVLKEIENHDALTEVQFYQLIADFKLAYLSENEYTERIKNHRQPIDLIGEFWQDIFRKADAIQYREEMKDYDSIKKMSGYVPTKIIDLWINDKRLKSLYNCVIQYCFLTGKNPVTIGTHIAEYRALVRLGWGIQRQWSKRRSIFQEKSINVNPPVKTKKTRTKISNTLRAELQQEVDSKCPFCLNSEVGVFEGHHIDENPSNTKFSNLILVCPTCHSKITKSKISREEVISVKQQLINKTYTRLLETTSPSIYATTANVRSGNNTTININTSRKKIIQKHAPGSIGSNNEKGNYIDYLIKRFNEYKAYEVGKENVKYWWIIKHLKSKYKLGQYRTLLDLPIDKFEELAAIIQGKIKSTKLARIKGKQHKNYSTFEEHKNISPLADQNL
jgi:hypothetical protein